MKHVRRPSEVERKEDLPFPSLHLCPKHVFPDILGFILSLTLLSVPGGCFSAMWLTSNASPTQIRTTFLLSIFLL